MIWLAVACVSCNFSYYCIVLGGNSMSNTHHCSTNELIYLFFCQVIVSLVDASPSAYTEASKPGYYQALFPFTVYGFFSLDIFHYYYRTSLCISSTMTTIQALSLEYIVAIYPLLLTILFSVCIQLHARDCKPLVYLWKPFQKCTCCACMPQKWSPLESLVHTLSAGFLLLSYSKIFKKIFQFVTKSGIHTRQKWRGPLSLFYNATVPYFSTEHLPFAILGIFILTTFIVLPVLVLLLYPTRVFQRCIGCCSTRWHALDAFVDAFQGCYKNGTNGTPDWQYFSGLYT